MDANMKVIGLGHAITDMVYRADSDFLGRHGLSAGGMTLVDADTACALRSAAETAAVTAPAETATATVTTTEGAVQVSAGGGAANTIGHLARLGVGAEILVRVGDDAAGSGFVSEMESLGVRIVGGVETGGVSGQCLVFVSDDGGVIERTMATCLGVSQGLLLSAVNDLGWGDAGWLFLEGYLWDSDAGRLAALDALGRARGSGVRAALTLSDFGCVERHRDEFLGLLSEFGVFVFGNEREAGALLGVSDTDGQVKGLRELTGSFALTLGAEGSVVCDGGEVFRTTASVVEGVVADVTGAGDIYAAGYLCGRLRGLGVGESGEMGSRAARETLGYLGARVGGDFAARVLGLD